MKKLVLPVLMGIAALTSASLQAATLPPASFNVNVTLNAACQLTTAPGAINLTYTSFAAAAVSATTPVTVNCTNSLPYTLSLNTANADQLGLTIPLEILDNGGAVATFPVTSGNAAANYSIRATISAGQRGTCASSAVACTGTVARTLTVTY